MKLAKMHTSWLISRLFDRRQKREVGQLSGNRAWLRWIVSSRHNFKSIVSFDTDLYHMPVGHFRVGDELGFHFIKSQVARSDCSTGHGVHVVRRKGAETTDRS